MRTKLKACWAILTGTEQVIYTPPRVVVGKPRKSSAKWTAQVNAQLLANQRQRRSLARARVERG